MEKCVLLFGLQHFLMNHNLGLYRRRHGLLTDNPSILQKMKLGKLLVQYIVLLLDPSLGLKNWTGVTPRILADGNQRLVLITDLGRDLINARPSDLLHRAPPIRKESLGLMRLDPDLIQMLGQRLPVRVGPLGIGDPEIATSLRKKARIQNLKKDIDLSLLALGESLGNLTKLDIVFPENVGDNSHQKSSILHQSGACTRNQVDSHYITSGCVL